MAISISSVPVWRCGILHSVFASFGRCCAADVFPGDSSWTVFFFGSDFCLECCPVVQRQVCCETFFFQNYCFYYHSSIPLSIFQGVGVAMVLISAIVAVYLNVVSAWSLFYFINSVSFSLPWSNCVNSWSGLSKFYSNASC